MSTAMASDQACTEDAMNLRTDEGVSSAQQILEDVEDRLVTLSEKIFMCNRVLTDLQDLSDVVVRKSLLDVPLPPQK